MVLYAVDKSSSSSTSCLTVSLSGRDRQGGGSLGKKASCFLTIYIQVSFGYILLASLKCTAMPFQ